MTDFQRIVTVCMPGILWAAWRAFKFDQIHYRKGR